MTIRLGHAVAASVIAVLVGGCSAGVKALADDGSFRQCATDRRVEMSGTGDWTVAQWRSFVSKPEVLDCMVETLEPDQREDVFAEVYPEVTGSDEDDLRVRFAPTDAFVAYAAAYVDTYGKTEVIGRVATLMSAMWWQKDVDSEPGREQVALTLVQATMGIPDYRSFLEEQNLKDDYTGRAQYITHMDYEAAPSEQIRDLTATLRDKME